MVVGLAAVTPASGYVTPMAAVVIGAVAAPLSYYAMRFREGVGGTNPGCLGLSGRQYVGMIATGLFATVAVNSGGANGLFFGNPARSASNFLAWWSPCFLFSERRTCWPGYCMGEWGFGCPRWKKRWARYQFPGREVLFMTGMQGRMPSGRFAC
jgi:hypothetical protein